MQTRRISIVSALLTLCMVVGSGAAHADWVVTVAGDVSGVGTLREALTIAVDITAVDSDGNFNDLVDSNDSSVITRRISFRLGADPVSNTPITAVTLSSNVEVNSSISKVIIDGFITNDSQVTIKSSESTTPATPGSSITISVPGTPELPGTPPVGANAGTPTVSARPTSIEINNVTLDTVRVEASGAVALTNSTITGNSTIENGGAIKAVGSVEIKSNSILSNNESTGIGGAIYSALDVQVSNSQVLNNKADQAGAIYSGADGVTIKDASEISGNESKSDGGAIFSIGNVLVESSELSNNVAIANGGAIATGSNIDIVHSTLNGNQSDGAGGAIFSSGSESAITVSESSELVRNIAAYAGGAIYAAGSVTVADSKISGYDISDVFPAGFPDVISEGFPDLRNAYAGGAIYAGGSIDITSSTISENVATFGGALASPGLITINSSRFSRNMALANGGAIYSDCLDFDSACLFSENTRGVSITGPSIFENNLAAGIAQSGLPQGYGGAIYLGNPTLLNIAGTGFIDNHAEIGGAIASRHYISGEGPDYQPLNLSDQFQFVGLPLIINSTFYENYASDDASSIYDETGINQISNTFYNNGITRAPIININDIINLAYVPTILANTLFIYNKNETANPLPEYCQDIQTALSLFFGVITTMAPCQENQSLYGIDPVNLKTVDLNDLHIGNFDNEFGFLPINTESVSIDRISIAQLEFLYKALAITPMSPIFKVDENGVSPLSYNANCPLGSDCADLFIKLQSTCPLDENCVYNGFTEVQEGYIQQLFDILLSLPGEISPELMGSQLVQISLDQRRNSRGFGNGLADVGAIEWMQSDSEVVPPTETGSDEYRSARALRMQLRREIAELNRIGQENLVTRLGDIEREGIEKYLPIQEKTVASDVELSALTVDEWIAKLNITNPLILFVSDREKPNGALANYLAALMAKKLDVAGLAKFKNLLAGSSVSQFGTIFEATFGFTFETWVKTDAVPTVMKNWGK